MGDTIDKATADAEFGKQIDAHSTWKTLIDPSTLSPSQQTALASFEYNL
jgi:GH24 family phage-related lysozyme (muramidase)